MPFRCGQDFTPGFLGNLGKFARSSHLLGNPVAITSFFLQEHGKQPNGGHCITKGSSALYVGLDILAGLPNLPQFVAHRAISLGKINHVVDLIAKKQQGN